MAEREKYNIRSELKRKDEEIHNILSLQGISSLTQLGYNNAMRTNMFTMHTRQLRSLDNPDIPKSITGAENVVGMFSDGYKRVKHNYTVFKKVYKYKELLEERGLDPNDFFYDIFLYDEENDKYALEHIMPCKDLSEMFAFKYNNDYTASLEEGDVVEKDTVLYKSTSYDESMNYGYGQNFKVAYSLDPWTHEDAAAMSINAARRMLNTDSSIIRTSINDNDFPLNIFGTREHYKGVPLVGDRLDGILLATRRKFNNQLLTDFKTDNLMKLRDGDTTYFAMGKVIDVTIYCNNENLPDNTFYKEINLMLEYQTQYYQELYDICDWIINKSGSKYTREIDHIYDRASKMINMESKWDDGDGVYSNLIIDFHVMNTVDVQIGQKISPRYGNKSVVAKIVKDDDLPYYFDESGERHRVDLLLPLLSIVNRTTGFPLYEIFINFCFDSLVAHMRSFKTTKEKEKLLFDALKLYNPEYGEEQENIYKSLTKQQKEEWFEDIERHGVIVRDIPLQESEPIFYRLMRLYYAYDFIVPYQLFIDKWGRTIPTINEACISDIYVMKLKQTSKKNFSVRNNGSIDSKELPSRSYKSRSHQELNSSTPITFGEYESLGFSIGIPPTELVLFHALFRTSPKARKMLSRLLLSGETECVNMPEYFTSRVAEILSVHFKSLGYRLEFTDGDEVIDAFTSEMGLHELDGMDVICTDFDFTMMERIQEIEKEIQSKHPVLDLEHLKLKVMKEFLSDKFLDGFGNKGKASVFVDWFYELKMKKQNIVSFYHYDEMMQEVEAQRNEQIKAIRTEGRTVDEFIKSLTDDPYFELE